MKFLVPKARWWWQWRYDDDSDYNDDGADVDADGSGGGDLGDHHVWQLLYVLWDGYADTMSRLSHRCLWLCYRPSPTTTSKKSWSSFFARWTGQSSRWGGITFWLWVDLFLLSSISNWGQGMNFLEHQVSSNIQHQLLLCFGLHGSDFSCVGWENMRVNSSCWNKIRLRTCLPGWVYQVSCASLSLNFLIYEWWKVLSPERSLL